MQKKQKPSKKIYVLVFSIMAFAEASFAEINFKFSDVGFEGNTAFAIKAGEFIKNINEEIKNDLYIPQKLQMQINKKDSNACFIPRLVTSAYDGKNYSSTIYVPIKLERDGKTLFEDTRPLLAHEYGHYLFYVNVMKREKLTVAKMRYLQETQKFSLEIEQVRKDFDNLIKEITPAYEKAKVSCGKPGYYIELQIECIQVVNPQIAKALNERLQEIKPKYELMKKQMNDREEASYKMSAIDELFADLVAAVHYDNPKIFAFFDADRDFFTKKYYMNNYYSRDIYKTYSPIRKHIWDLYKKSNLSKGAFLGKVLDGMIVEIIENKYKSTNVKMNNLSLLKSIAKKVEFSN